MSESRELTVTVTYEKDHVWAEVKELPGCFASGEDLNELQEALAEAIGQYLSNDFNPVRIADLTFVPPRELTEFPVRAHLVAA